ncbi:Eukaryotic translation initiation factor 5, partial [Nymphaea thermarum]
HARPNPRSINSTLSGSKLRQPKQSASFVLEDRDLSPFSFFLPAKMALQNIGAGNRDDAFYRYKMPKMITKIEGRGNGIKTNVVNMVDIAKALARPAAYTTKYFGCELGAQSRFDEKTGVSLVNGAHDTAKLAGLLENFIKKYVQCYGCGNPETEIIITKTQLINLKCAACGFVSDVDMRDKLTTFILKNPPETKKGGKDKKAMRRAEKERLKEGEAADEEQKAKKEVKKKVVATKASVAKKKAASSDEDHCSPAGSNADEENGDDDDDVQWQTDTSLEAARQRIQEQLSAVTAEMVMLNTEESKKEKPKHAKKSEAQARSPDKGSDNENGTATTRESLASEIKNKLKKGCTSSQLSSFLASLAGDQQQIMNALFEALFEGAGKGFAKAVSTKKAYLAAVTGEGGPQQLMLLRAVEEFCNKFSPDAMREVALVLKALYDDDVVEEECFLQWYDQGLKGGSNKSEIWKKVKPFVEWLQSAESESDDE